MRLLLITGGAYLKETYEGTSLVLVRMDGNNQIILIAAGMSQGDWRVLDMVFVKVEKMYRALLQKWYCARIEKYKDSTVNTLSDWATHKVMDRIQKSANWKVHEIDYAVGRTMGCPDCSEVALGWFRKTTLYSTYQDLADQKIQIVLNHKGRNRFKYDVQGAAARISNNYVRSKEYEAAYIYNNYVKTQEYEAAYTNIYVRSQEYGAAYNSMGSQEYEAAYNSMDGRSQYQNLIMSNLFSQFKLGQSSKQTYSTWDHVNLADL
nr:hypothetical protein [Tanacetum cinerariifolium]